MAPRIPHVLMTVHGLLPAGEVWSCGLRSLAWSDPLGDAKGVALAVAVGNAWRVFANVDGPHQLFGNSDTSTANATIDGVTVRTINENGVTVEQYEGSPTTAKYSPLGSTSSPLPNQCALVLTLATARAGRTGKGRLYLPCIGNPGLNAGRINAGAVGAIASAAKGLIDTINLALATATDAACFVAVQSAKVAAEGVGQVPSGYMGAKVISVRVGDVIDTQRRRRSSITESYSTQVIA